FEGIQTNYIIPNAGYQVREGRQIELKSIDDLSLFLPDEEIQVIAAGPVVPDEFMRMLDEEMTFFIMRTYADCVIKGCNKAKGIERAIELTGVKRENTIAIGDSNNDLAMLEYAGVSVAMGNSQENILQMADYVTDTAANSGVAKAIQKYLL
ncbi:MAG: HAD-IIB family hydrolase, partial [Clostridia bacterium]|nr:HAD-IIB family hydrolase [Clostridia bacterium]